MRFEARVGERGEIVIPEDVRAELRLVAEMRVAVQVSPMNSEPHHPEPNWEKAREIAASLREGMRADLLADGYATVDDFIRDIRGR